MKKNRKGKAYEWKRNFELENQYEIKNRHLQLQKDREKGHFGELLLYIFIKINMI